MKKNYVWAAALLMLAACSNEDVLTTTDNPDRGNEGCHVTVTATLPGNDSRVALQDVTENGKNIIKVAWNESGEAFTVMTTNEQQVTSEENDGGNVFTQEGGNQFVGTLPSAVNGQPYYAIYPPVDLYYVDDEGNDWPCYWDGDMPITSFSATKVPFDLSVQDGELGITNPLMYATSTGGQQFDFRHLTAIVKFTLGGLSEVGDGEIEFKITWQGGCPPWGVLDLTGYTVAEMYPDVDDSQECSVNVFANIIEGTATFYAYLPPIDQGKTLNISYSRNDYNKTDIVDYTAQVNLNEKSIEAGKYYRAERTVTKNQISTTMTAGNVQELKEWLDVSRKYAGGIDLTLTADIDLTNADLDGDPSNESNWPSQLYLNNVTIDGGGHTLTGLKMNVSGEGEAATMFGYADENSVVKNLHLRNVQLSSSSYFAAGVVADNYGTVSGCSVSGNIQSTAGGYAAGGVVADNIGTVMACYNSADVSNTGFNAGGVVGKNSTYVDKKGSVRACYSTGAVSAATGTGYAGGVIGSNLMNATVTACYWSGTGVTKGIGEDIGDYIVESQVPQVDGTTVTWSAAAQAMNNALPDGFGWQYVENTDNATKEKEPLKLKVTP
ncbi:MAG: hypothetical protein IJA00_04575 [Bacteroidaceae bacterium]|nr:hypothetical protein [Bacteroidaceae bacterium]